MTETRKERLGQILLQMYHCGQSGGCTRKDIADALGLKKTPHITQMLRQLVADGWAEERIDTTGWPIKYLYFPTEKTLTWYAGQAA